MLGEQPADAVAPVDHRRVDVGAHREILPYRRDAVLAGLELDLERSGVGVVADRGDVAGGDGLARHGVTAFIADLRGVIESLG